MNRAVGSIIAAVVVIVIAVGLTVAPIPGLFGMSTGALEAVEVTVASGLATVLLWYGSQS